MPNYLVVPENRRARAIHDAARALRLHWLRTYIIDVVDDPDLFGESLGVRAVDAVVLHLAAANGWKVRDDPIGIAARLGVRPRDVRPAIARLLAMGRFQLVYEPDAPKGRDVQIELAVGEISTPVQEDPPSHHDANWTPPRDHHDANWGPLPSEVVESVSAQIEDSLSKQVPGESPRQKQEQEKRRESVTSNGSVSSYAAAANALESNTITNRIIALVAGGDERSAAVIRYEAAGLPDALLARTLESYLARRPRPSRPAGYVVSTLRALRAEANLPDTRPKIEREPAL